MEKATIEHIAMYQGKEVELAGWLYNKRSSGKIQFLQLRDGTGIIQCVVARSDVTDKVFEDAQKLTQESSFYARGTIKADPRSPIGYEMLVKDIEIIQIAKDYPITPKEHGIEFLLERRHLWLRSRRQFAVLRIRAEVISAIRDYLDNNGFILMDTPIFTPAACEGTTTLFSTKYFEEDTAYLSQSGQLYNEATAMAFRKVYCFGPTFRAEKSKTRKHLIEFWMVEPEIAFADLYDVMDICEDLTIYIIERVLENRRMELQILQRDTSKLEAIKKPFPRITYQEAVDIIKKAGRDFEDGNDFGAPDEEILGNTFERPVFVHRFPAAIKAFYMKRAPEDESLVLGCDMIAPEGYGELIGGSQREDDLETLEKRIIEHKLPRQAFEWFLDLRRYGTVPHSGFGMGLERTVAWIAGVEHIRETIPFPRMLYRMYP